jgi:hypothetical protein
LRQATGRIADASAERWGRSAVQTGGTPLTRPTTSGDHIAALCLAGAWALTVLAVDPRGEFPLIDDWSYARTVRGLLDAGRLEYDGWASPTLLFHVLYGAAFSLPTGFSMTTLRVSTLVAAFVAVLGIYRLLRHVGATVPLAAFGAAVVMFDPVFVQHAFTFMTDVTFLALEVLALLFFVRYFKSGRPTDVAAATIVSVCATLVRDIGIAIPLAAAAAQWLTQRAASRRWMLAAASAAVTVVALIGYKWTLQALDIVSPLHGMFERHIGARVEGLGPTRLLKDAAWTSVGVFEKVALAALPLVVLAARRPAGLRGRPPLTIACIVVAVAACYAVVQLPRTGGADIGFFSMWPVGLLNGATWDQQALFTTVLARLTDYVAPIAAAGLACALAAATWLAFRRGEREAAPSTVTVFTVICALLLIAPVAAYGSFFPRYILPFLPLVALALIPLATAAHRAMSSLQRWTNVAAVFLLAAYAALSMAATHDYLAWNRTRWEAIRFLVEEQRVPPASIDGGFEAMGWYLFNVPGPVRERFINWSSNRSVRPFWANDRALYFVIFAGAPASPQYMAPDAEVVWRKGFRACLPGRSGAIEIRRKTPGAAASAGSGSSGR